MTNMTYVQAIDFALDVMNPDVDPEDDKFNWEEVREKLEALKAQLAKRTSAKTPTKTQKENEVIMENILSALADIGKPVTVTDLLAHGVEGYELTNQKTSALLRKLVEANKVTKTIEGKKAMFCIA